MTVWLRAYVGHGAQGEVQQPLKHLETRIFLKALLVTVHQGVGSEGTSLSELAKTDASALALGGKIPTGDEGLIDQQWRIAQWRSFPRAGALRWMMLENTMQKLTPSASE